MADKKNLFIFETGYWRVELVSDQAYLGRVRVELKRRCPDFAGITEDEMSDLLVRVIRRYEGMVKKVFGAVTVNWSFLVNAPYLNSPPNPQAHFNVRPRYDKPVSFAGEEFKDELFGKHYSMEVKEVSEEVLKKIAEKLLSVE